MSRRPGTPRSPFFRTETRRKTPASGGANSLSRRLHHETLEKRELLAADLLAIRPDAGALIAEGTRLSTPPREFSLLFNGDANLAESSINNDSIRLIRAGGDATFGTADDVQVSLGYVGFVEPGDTSADNLHKIVLRPASTASANATDPSFAFPDDFYRIEIIGSGTNPLEDRNGVPFNGGQDSITPFRLDRGIQVIAVIPQPIERQTDGSLVVHDNRIDVYFDDQDIAVAVAQNPAFYRLVDTAGAASAAITPNSVTYFPAENRVQLNFAAAIPTATYRLDVGTSLAPTGSSGVLTQTFTGEIGTSFKDLLAPSAAGNIGNLSSGTSVKVASTISAAGAVALPARPGGLDEPGHREIQLEAHYGSAGLGPVAPTPTQTRYYSFPSTFPTNGAGITYQNFISPSEKDIARGILEIYAQQIGVEFIESNTSAGLVIGKGDLQAADPGANSGAGGVAGLGGGNLVVLDKDDFTESNRFFGDGFTGVAFHEIGHALGLGHAYDTLATMGGGLPNDGTGSNVQPGDNDIVHLQRISPPNSNDIDLFRFNLVESGKVQIETNAERLATPSLLNTVLRLFRKNSDGTSVLLAQNDRYYGSDSLVNVELPAGEYFFGVSSAGNENYDPAIANSGFGGTTGGNYQVQISFTATPTAAQQLTDINGTPIDGDGDGTPGGVNSFWFESNPNAIIVDKLANAGGTGSLAAPFNSIGPALAAAQAITVGGTTRALVRIVGNVDESSPTGLRDATPYLVGSTRAGSALADGNSLTVPKGTTVRIEAGALIKLRAANIDVGTSSIGADRSGGAIQVLGTPTLPVYLRSYHDDQAGGDSDGNGPAPNGGDYGGIVLREDSDLEASGVFLSAINHADIRHGGGKGTPTGTRVFSPIDIIDARPTTTFNTITDAAKAAISASPNSFDDSLGRIGPDILGNYLRGNTDNGLFVGIPTDLGSSIQKMTVSGRFDDTDITHILTESLIIVGNPGGPIRQDGVLIARPSGRLMIDPGTVIKLREARIESERGAATLIAEGTANSPIIFTSLADSRYGGSGDFKTNSGSGAPVAGNWGGLFFGEASRGSLDHTVIAFGGGVVPTAATAGGASDSFNAVEIHQADVRIANSLITDNASGRANSDRFGRGNNQAAAIYVRGAQPIIVDNQIVRNDGPAININANSLQYETLVDRGRSIGAAERYTQFDDNRGPLIRLNELDNNIMNGLKVRGEELATQSVWDDSDIVHILNGQITVGNHHTYSGLRLQSNVSESLVVKVDGANSGFTATGKPLDIVDRIGGTIQVIGLPGYPVVITQLADDSVGAGFTPDGHLMTDTNNGGGEVGNQTWQGFKFDQWSNDRNVAIIREAESPLTGGESINSSPITKAQPLGVLAPDLKSGDENRRLGFQVHGYISPDDAKDQDVYSFQATAGTRVWIDIDRTNTTLDTVFDVVLDDGTPSGIQVFSSDNPIPVGNANSLVQEPLLGGDYYTLTNNDPGASVMLTATGTYYVRVRAAAVDHDGNAATPPVPVSKGEYQLQVRLRQVDEFPGSTVRYADVRYASTAFDVQGLPRHSPLVGDAAEAGEAGGNVTSTSAQDLGNLLVTDTAAISLAGSLSSAADVDVYEFLVKHDATQVIPGVTKGVGTVAVVFDMDYADKKRGDTSIAVFDENSRLIFIGRESNIADDQPAVGGDGQSLNDLSRGSLGTDDPYIGPVHLISGAKYYVAVMSNQVTPSVVASQFAITGPSGTGTAGTLTRLEPLNSVDRVVEDHIGFTGYLSSQAGGAASKDIQPTTGPLLEINTSANLDTHVAAFRLQDVNLFLATDQTGDDGDNLYTVDPKLGGPIVKDLTPNADNLTDGANDIQDIVIRGDGVMYGYRRNVNGANTVGQLVTLNPFDGTVLATQNDNIPGVEGFTNVRDVFNPANPFARSRSERASEVVNSDEVDAVTYRRVSDTGGDAPAPRYETFYSVRESDNASRLYRGNADGNAAPAVPTTTTNRYGFIGDIQPVGVTFAETFLSINNGSATAFQNTDILLRSNVPGETGSFNINITRGPGGNAADVSFFGNTLNIRLRQAGDPLVVNATANDIVNAINNNAAAKTRLIALIYSGNDNANGDGSGGVVAVNANAAPAVGVGTAAEVLQGRVTGLSMSRFDGTGSLYGVTSAGEFISVSQANGRATVLSTVPGVKFSGLAMGPQNVEGGAYKNLMFATTTTGRVYAFDTTGGLAQIFGTTGTATSMQVSGTDGAPIGLAFSPVDFNLWHPTMLRANDGGHGINLAPDGSRNALGEGTTIVDGITGSRNTSQGAGGASFYFGLEEWRRNPNADFQGYLSPTDRSENSQYGLNALQHQDLSSNTNIRNTYDLAGGARGSLTTNDFSLADASYYDRPTLYLNYLLETEAATGKNVGDVNADNFFRDSARIYASRNNGATWELLATNNSTLSGTDRDDGNARAELPTFLSHVADAGVNSAKPQPQTKQIVQELFDETHGSPLWHQARIDLSPFAGATSIKLRFDFSTSGSSIEGILPGDSFGDVGDPDNSVGGSNNNHEGFYIDDIIVGFAERGEMVTNAPPTTDNGFVDLSQSDRSNVKRDQAALTNQLSGEYQLEMRRTGEYAAGAEGTIVVAQTFDTNVRHILNSALGTGLDADRNKQREQGLLILENNILSDSRVVGVRVTPPAPQGDGNGVTFPGPVQNFSDKDDQRLVPGVVIQNNIIVGSSGVDYSGQPNGSPQSAVPIGRIINNTFIGNGGGQFGVNIHDNASPTLLNNVFSTLGNGILNGGVGAVIDNNYFHNAGAVVGSDPRSGTKPLFVDPAGRNYYPLPTAGTINNSQDVLNDRGAYAAFKNILGIPQSPYFAPNRDVFGQLRVSGGVGGDGAGANTDTDIGAADYSDFVQPYAKLLNPVDQDDAGLDSDPAETFIQLNNPDLRAFSVLLSDGENSNSPFEGSGIDPDTVNAATVLIRQDNRLLKVGRDFNLAFNPSTGELRLTPLSDLWNPNSVYEIILLNGDHKAVSFNVSSGSAVKDGDKITVSNGTKSMTIEFDSGYVVQLGAANTILDGQTFEYGTATGTKGYTARFQINKLATTAVGEFTGEVGLGRVPADDDVTINVTNPSAFAVGDFIRISDEIMAVVGVNVAGAELTVERAVLGTPRLVHQAGALSSNRIELVDQEARAVISAAIGGTATDTSFLVLQGNDLGLDATQLGLAGKMTFLRVNDEFMRVTGYAAATGRVTVQRGALGSKVTAHPQYSIAEVVDNSRSAALSPTQTVNLDDVLLDGTTAGPLTVTGSSLLASDRVMEVTPDATFVPKIGDLLQIGTEIVKIIDIQPGAVAGDLSLGIDRGLFDTAVVEHTATTTEIVAGVATTYPTSIRLIDSAFVSITIFESDPLNDVLLPGSTGVGPGQVQSGISSKIGRALREFQQTQPGTAGDLDLRLPHAQGIEGGRVYLGGHVGDTIAFSSGSAAALSASLVPGAQPGVAAGVIAVPYIPSIGFTQSELNAAVLSAINNSQGLGLSGVSEGGDGFYLVNKSGGDIGEITVTSTASGFSTITSDVHGIADRAGNLLRPNRSTQTRFTIGVGPTSYDFGDGVDTADPNNRARHTILGLGDRSQGDPRLSSPSAPGARIVDSEDISGLTFNLSNVLRDDAITPPPTRLINAINALSTTIQVTAGTAVSLEGRIGGYLLLGDEIVRLNAVGPADSLTITRGQLGSLATGHSAASTLAVVDDENGLDLSSVDATFNVASTRMAGGGPVMVNVLATDYGVVDGWIDFNHNGKLDVGDNPTNYDERVFNSVAVWPGENRLPVNFPTTLPGGATITGDMIMRLRISKLGGLSADGLAIGGEVEDHKISIVAGVPPMLTDLNYNTPDGTEPEFFEMTEHVLGSAATVIPRKIFNASTDADGNAISILEIVDPNTGRAYPVKGGVAVIDQWHDSLGRLAGSLTVSADSTVTFLPRSNYDTSPLAGPDNIPGTADDVTPTLGFAYRLVDSTGVAGHLYGSIPSSVKAVNQAPSLDAISMSTDGSIDLDALFEDQDLNGDGVTDIQNVTLTGISAGAGNIQPVRVTVTTKNLADNGSGTFVDAGSQVPLLITNLSVLGLDGAAYDGGSSHAKLNFNTTPDQYGTASITVTVTDPGADGDFATAADNLFTSRVVTVTVAPVNDKPATVERLWTKTEAAEGAGDAPIAFSFTASDLAGTSGVTNPFDNKTRVNAGGSGAAPFNESNQLNTLKVSKLIFLDDAVITYTRTNASGPTLITQSDRTLQFANLYDATGVVTYSDVTVKFSGSDGETGSLVVKHSLGKFNSGVYTPKVDVNNNYDGIPQELQYVISDSGVSIAPKVIPSSPDVQLGATNPIESNPETIRFSILSKADAPFLGDFRADLNIDETEADSNPANDSYTFQLADLFTDEDLAFLLGAGADETDTVPASWITITANPGNPARLMSVPTVSQTTDSDPISLTFTPVPDAYGVAEFSVKVTNPNNGLSSATKALTVRVNPTNDAPLTSDRIVTGQEDIAKTFDINDLIRTASNPSRASIFVGDGVTPPIYDESEQDLVVYGFKYLDTEFLSATYNNGPGVNVQQIVQLPNGNVTLTFRAGVFVSGSFMPDPDYFVDSAAASALAGDVLEYMVIDAGSYDLYGPGTGANAGTPVIVGTAPVVNPVPGGTPLFASATITFVTQAVNDPPTIPTYTPTVKFYEDQPTSFGGVLQTNIFANPSTDLILPGPGNERTTQTMVQPITLTYVSGTTGMLSGNPTLSLNGNLSVMPVADAFGTAVYEITLTDSEGATKTPKPRVTITIDPVNDKPVAFNRSIIMDEAIEPATVSQTITADDLLLGNRLNRGETAEKPAISAREGINPLFRESDLLEIAEIIVPDSNGNSRPFRGSSNEPTQVVTAAGGTLTLTFAPSLSTNVPAGTMRFVSAVYTPAIDYNQTTPYFKVTDDFQFVVRDGGLNTTDQDALLQHRNLSEAASARISVVAKNDPPIFPTLEITNNTITFTEIEVGNTAPQRKDVYAGAGTRVQAGPATAIDELALQQSVGVRFVPVAVPAGLMASLPTMTNDGVIEVHPNADAFGDAVYDVIASDGILDTPAQRITIAITGTNDAPTATTYAFTTLEDQPITIHDIAMNEDLSAGSRASSLPVDSPFNESGQNLQVVGIGKADPANPANNLPTPFVLATAATIPYAFNATLGTMTATQQVKTPHGTLDVTFQQRVNGELASGFISKIVYTPDPGYNDTLPDDTFTYFVSDYGSIPVPGSNPARELVIPTDVPSKLSPPARISVSVGPVNTPPTVPDFENNGVFTFEEDATTPDTIRTQVFLEDSLVIDAGGGLDEADQTVRITLTANDTALASQLFSAPPTLSADGTLQVFPNANAFGTIVYTLSVVDLSPEGDVLTNPPVTKSLTLFINSVNDQPTAAAKSFSLVEHREGSDTNGNPNPTSDGNGYRDIAASTLLLNNASGGAAQPNSFVNSIGAPFNEASQLSALRVVGLGLPGSTSPLKSATDPALVYSAVAGVLVATDTLETGNGTLTITYQQSASDATDKFVQSIRYTPDADYNSSAPFDPTDTFTYFVDDRGPVNHLSAPAAVTMSVTPTNDLPFIPTLRSDTANAAEFVVGDEGGPYTTNVFSMTGAVIMPGPAPSGTSLGARDENANSTVHIELQQISGPTGMFNSAPTLTDNGTLTLDADPDAFGSAVYDIVVSERDLDGNTNPALDQIRRQRITITLSSGNDAPSAPSRILEMLEFSELENGTGNPVTTDPTLIAVSEARLLDLAGEFEGPALAGGSIAFPEIQTLHVTGIGLPGNVTPTVSGSSLVGDYALNPETGKLEATGTLTLANGVLTVTFVEVTSGGETERYLDRLSYVPDVDYNTATPGTTPDQFTYFVTDSGTPAETSAPALVSLRVNPNNDVPTFTVNSDAFGPNNTLYSPIRNDNGTTTFPGLVSDLSPGPQTAADEQANQTVVFRYQPVDSAGMNGTDLATLFRREPDLIDGVLYLYPANNASGTATLVFRADDGPDSRLNPNTKYQELTLQINIGSAPAPDGPIRTGTYNNPAGSGVAIVDLNDVFISVDGLNLSETEILTNGANGVASINPTTGNLEYRPNPGHVGEDIVIIQVQDNSGVISGAVEVQFNTTNFRLTNPVIPEDVNRSGLVTSLDALLIINLLNAQANGDGVPISSIVGDDYFYDVSDNAVITSLDALRVINYLNDQDPDASPEPVARRAAGLQSFAAQQLEVKAEGSSTAASESNESTIGTDLSKLDGSDGMEVSEFNVMDLIAIDREHEKTKTDAVDSWETNLDAAISDLF